MAKPRKKYNHKAASIRAKEKFIRNSFIILVHELAEEGLRFYINGKWIKDEEIIRHGDKILFMQKNPHQWTMITGVLCRTPNGKEFIDYHDCVTKGHHYYEDLDPLASDNIKTMLDKNNKEHILSSFFVGIPNSSTLSETELINLLYEMGADKLNTWYERNLLLNKAIQELSQFSLKDYLHPLTAHALNQHGITHFGQIRQMGSDALIKLKGIGETRIKEIYDRFSEMILANLESLPKFMELQQDEFQRGKTLAYFEKPKT